MRICSNQIQSHHWLDFSTAACNCNTLNNTNSRKSNFTLNFLEECFRVACIRNQILGIKVEIRIKERSVFKQPDFVHLMCFGKLVMDTLSQ